MFSEPTPAAARRPADGPSNASSIPPPLEPIVIVDADRDDVRQVASLHELAFTGFFLTQMGGPFLRAYYRSIIQFPDGILRVAKDGPIVVGFAAGFRDPQRFYRELRDARRRYLPSIALALARRPWLWPRLLANVRRVQRAEPPACGPSEACCELASLAVAPAAEGRGVGRRLVESFVTCSRQSGARALYLTTDADNNERVNAFYQRLGFRHVGRRQQSRSRWLNEYVLDWDPSAAMPVATTEAKSEATTHSAPRREA